MPKLDKRLMDSPDETRTFEKGRSDVVRFDGFSLARVTLEPGWKWSQSVKPIAGTESCEHLHAGYCITGRLHVVMNDGAEAEVGPGESYTVPPGHDAWVVGDDTFQGLEFSSAEGWAKR